MKVGGDRFKEGDGGEGVKNVDGVQAVIPDKIHSSVGDVNIDKIQELTGTNRAFLSQSLQTEVYEKD